MSENTSNERKTIQFNAAPMAIAPSPQYYAFLEAARAEALNEREKQEQLEREPLAWQIKDGRAAGPLYLKKTSKSAVTGAPAGAFALDCGEMGAGDSSSSSVQIINPITQEKVNGTILKIHKDNVVVKVSPTLWNPNENVKYFLRKAGSNFAGPYVHHLSSNSDIRWPVVCPPGPMPCSIPKIWIGNGENFLDCLEACLTFRGVGSIKGPPGTGKTYLLAHAAALLAETDHTIIVAALSHAAVDNALRKIAEICNQLPSQLKPAKRASSKNPQLSIPQLSPQELQGENTFGTYKIIGMTLAALIKAGKMAKADFLFLEEAGQIPAFQAAALSTAGKHMILFGDEQQLEPILGAKQRNILNSAVSSMEFIRRSYPDRVRTLTANHRSNASTVEFTRKHHYPSVGLEAATNASSTLSEPVDVELSGKTVTLPTSGVVTIPIEHVNRSKASPEESEACVKIVQSLLGKTILTPDGERELTIKDFAVLSPNKRQAQLVLRHFNRLPEFMDNTPLCGTVHKLQGQGIPIVIFSITASHKGYMEKTAEFLFNPSLWNVATSRAATLCVILGNQEALGLCRPKTLKGMEMKQKALLQIEDGATHL